MLNAHLLFDGFKPASLNANELSFFDKREEEIVKAVLPSQDESPNKNRRKILVSKDQLEQKKKRIYTF